MLTVIITRTNCSTMGRVVKHWVCFVSSIFKLEAEGITPVNQFVKQSLVSNAIASCQVQQSSISNIAVFQNCYLVQCSQNYPTLQSSSMYSKNSYLYSKLSTMVQMNFSFITMDYYYLSSFDYRNYFVQVEEVASIAKFDLCSWVIECFDLLLSWLHQHSGVQA